METIRDPGHKVMNAWTASREILWLGCFWAGKGSEVLSGNSKFL